ncbi:H-2 class II histocompatibility antigen, E-S beta chain-like [Hoplias malabaricus]|uniref:H-2 class II histocompatibility antigen, E-S beta chain-like n=1 Tax=Hoplias malabaricus TaxID=27720 RepID=UPI0034617E9D
MCRSLTPVLERLCSVEWGWLEDCWESLWELSSSSKETTVTENQTLTVNSSLQDLCGRSCTLQCRSRQKMNLSLQLLLLLTLTVRTGLTDIDSYYEYYTLECSTSSTDLTNAELIVTWHFNKVAYLRFNSTSGKFVGFTEYGLNYAYNSNNSSLVQLYKGEMERYCKPSLSIDFSKILEKAVEPKVELMSEKQFSGGHAAMLVCSAYNFYPRDIDVYWLRDGKRETTYVTATDELADGDWYYQIHSHLEYTPKSGEKISCVVEHASLSGPMTYDWDPSLPESERNKIAIGASGLVLGIILSAAGFIYYKKISSGRILVPS